MCSVEQPEITPENEVTKPIKYLKKSVKMLAYDSTLSR